MPKSPDTDLAKIEAEIKKIILKDGSKFHKCEQVPIAFGLKAVEFIFMRDESKGGTESLEQQFSKIAGVESVEVLDVRRAFG